MSINSNKEEGVRGGEVTQLRRIADILDEILRLVKADQKMEHINLKEKYASLEPDPNEEN